MIYHNYDMKRIHFKQISSTHLFAKDQLEHLKLFDITIITADFQTGGIGRRKSPWIAPKNSSLLASFVYKAPPSEEIPYLSQKASKALQKALQFLDLPITFKYPNDLMVRGKKVAGIISEVYGSSAISSLGLNLLQSENQMDLIDQPATSLFLETGKIVSKEEVLKGFYEHFFCN